MYLTEQAIDLTLKYMAKYPSGSKAVVTFHEQPSTQSSASSELANRVSDVGEPFVSYFTPENFKDKMLAAGFVKVALLTPAHSAHYFQNGNNSLPNPKKISIAAAIV